MKNKLMIVILVLIIAFFLGLGYEYFFGPETLEGDKEVTLEIIIENQDIEESFIYNTEQEILYELLKEKEEELGVNFQSFSHGTMVTGLLNYNTAENEYFHIYINNEDALTGVDEIVLQDGDTYLFELKEF